MVLKYRPASVHFHDPELIPAALLLATTSKTITIFDCHENLIADIKTKKWLRKIEKKILIALLSRFLVFAARKFDLIIGATDSITADFEKFGARTIAIKNYPLDSFGNRKSTEKHRPRTSAVYVGRISSDRGLVEMISITKELGLTLSLIGNIDPDCCMMVQQSDHVIYHGYLSQESSIAIAQKSLFGFCLLYNNQNYEHALPTKIFEYMQIGLPTVSSNQGIQASLVEKSEAGIVVDIKDLVGATQAVKELVETPETRRKMSELGRTYCKENFSWRSEEGLLLAAYSHLFPKRITEYK